MDSKSTSHSDDKIILNEMTKNIRKSLRDSKTKTLNNYLSIWSQQIIPMEATKNIKNLIASDHILETEKNNGYKF